VTSQRCMSHNARRKYKQNIYFSIFLKSYRNKNSKIEQICHDTKWWNRPLESIIFVSTSCVHTATYVQFKAHRGENETATRIRFVRNLKLPSRLHILFREEIRCVRRIEQPRKPVSVFVNSGHLAETHLLYSLS
jgi:hypothetical protein